MKILAIRGRNLASLCGDFAVDLAAEPLASAGLFAITGPTGAGKSTLLDALCLALFDRTPRLDSRGGARVGRADQEENQRVPAKDVRGLLTRGQGSGFAEVDFASRDGRRWRARWQVRRARGRPGGRLQPQVLTLEDLDSGDQIGGTKTEVLHAIRERLGLSFDQFRRSALLAQGDFAAFLHAAAKERAELLEKVTGTAIYARLSEAAFTRAKRESEALEGLSLRRDHLGLLSAEERQKLEQDTSAATVALAAAKQTLGSAETAVRWYGERSKLRQLEDSGTVEHAGAEQQWQDARPRREILERVKAAQPLRARVEQLDTATRRRDEARERVACESDGLEDAREALAVAGKKLDVARTARSRTKQEQDTQAPELDKAAVLDDRLAAAERAAAEATLAATAAASNAREADEESTVAAHAVDEERKKREAADAWLKAHPDAQVLSGAWDHLAAALREHAQASRAAAQAGKALPKLKQAKTQAAAAVRLATDQAATAEGELEAAQQAVDRAEAAIPEGRQEQLEAERKICERRRDAIRAAEETLATARQIRAEQQRAEAAAEDARKRQQAAREKVEHTGDALRDHAVRMEEAERAQRAAQAVRDLEDRRAELTDGEACPLCGATDHPFRHGGVPSHVLTGQQQRVRELKAQGTRLTKEHATAQEQAKTFAAEAEKQSEQAAASVDQLAASQQAWERVITTVRELGPEESGPGEIALPADLLAAGVAAAVASAVAASQQALDDLYQREQECKAFEKQAKKARIARDTARQHRDQRVATREQARESARRADEALVAGTRRQKEEQERVSVAMKSLETSLAGRSDWRQQLAADGDAFRAACEREKREFQQQTTAREQASAALAAFEPRAAKVTAEAQAARDAAAAREESRSKLAAALEALRGTRQAVLGGRPVAEVKRALDQASASADKALDAASKVEAEKRAGWQAAEAKLEAARLQLDKESVGLEDAQRALNESLAKHEIDLETLRERLARDAAWCDHEGHELDAIRQAMRAAASVLAERRKRRQQHEETDRPDIPEAEAGAQQARASEAHQKAEALVQEQQVRRKQDDAARAQGELLAKQIARQEALAARWAMLNLAIGSHDGHKFRKFAQGLTLDSLLGYANAHLRDLAPRYHLDRVPDEDLELQVIDRDMGDEVRAINSLSGGETFLVSLALALGLSSLSASDTPVESLFIDEGFGTLDLKTLEVALSALDALQASGRQVGVISHVQDLGQRIGAQVRVVQLGAGRSRVEIQGGF